MSRPSVRDALASEYERYPGVGAHYEGKFSRVVEGRDRALVVRELIAVVHERDRRLSGLAARIIASSVDEEEALLALPAIVELVKSPERMNEDAFGALYAIAQRFPEIVKPVHAALWKGRAARHQQAAMLLLRFGQGRSELGAHLSRARLALSSMNAVARRHMFGTTFLSGWGGGTPQEAEAWAAFLKEVEQNAEFEAELRASMSQMAMEAADEFTRHGDSSLAAPFVEKFVTHSAGLGDTPWRGAIYWARLLKKCGFPSPEAPIIEGLRLLEQRSEGARFRSDAELLHTVLKEIRNPQTSG